MAMFDCLEVEDSGFGNMTLDYSAKVASLLGQSHLSLLTTVTKIPKPWDLRLYRIEVIGMHARTSARAVESLSQNPKLGRVGLYERKKEADSEQL